MVLDGLDLTLHAGEGLALLGENGAGKSTLLWLIAGIRQPTDGQLTLWGRSPREPAARRKLGLLPERPALPPGTVAQALELHRAVLRADPPAVERVVQRLALGPWLRRSTETLSSGMRQRVALAIALLGEPELLLLDEPLANLDPGSVEEVRGVLREERARGTTLLIATHRLDEVADLVDRAVRLRGGRLEPLGSPAQLLAELPCRILYTASGEDKVHSEVVEATDRARRVEEIGRRGGVVLRVHPLMARTPGSPGEP